VFRHKYKHPMRYGRLGDTVFSWVYTKDENIPTWGFVSGHIWVDPPAPFKTEPAGVKVEKAEVKAE
jgi:hypothetical protein